MSDQPQAQGKGRLAPARPLGNAVKQRLADLTRPVGTEEVMAVEYPSPRITVSIKEAAGVLAALLLFLGLWLVIQRPWDSVQSPPDLSAFEEYGAGDGSGHVHRDGYAQTATVLPATATTPPASSGEVVVAVVGAVQHPGLVTLAPGKRVADALEIAEVSPEAQVEAVNLAEKLRDGQQIMVPSAGQNVPQNRQENPPQNPPRNPPRNPQENPPRNPQEGTAISINSASAAELEQLPGVGEKTAAAIISYRNTHGPFTDLAQLEEVKGIGLAKLEAIRGAVTL